MPMRIVPILLIGCLMLSCSLSAAAQRDPLLQLVDMLKDNGSLTTAQHALLTRAIEDRLVIQAQPSTPPNDAEVIVRSEGGLEATTIDGEFSAKLGGTINLDAASYSEDRNQLGSGTELRRAKLALEGRLLGDWLYQLEVDFADNEVDLGDAYLAFVAGPQWRIKIGQHKEPFGLERLTGSQHLTFMERALPNVLTPGRSIGVSAGWLGQQTSVTGGLFAEHADSDPDDEFNEGWAATGRISVVPFADDRRTLHLGAAGSYRKPDQEDELSIRTRAETHITGVRHLDTGKIGNVSSIRRTGLEAAWAEGPASLQGEWFRSDIERSSGDPSLTFDGWYAQASWMLTGESRNYDLDDGRFKRPRPIHPHGAWELAGRISELDLNELDINGGQQRNITLGVNWYINRYLRLMANYIHVDSDIDADADGAVAGDDDFDVMQFRMQADF
jgi:phosphate-selective porin OprO/OprP